MTDGEIATAGDRIRSDVECACGDVAYEMEISDCPSCGDPHGAAADDLFNDEGFLGDIIGDRIYDASNDNTDRIKIAKHMQKYAHTALNNVLVKLINRLSK